MKTASHLEKQTTAVAVTALVLLLLVPDTASAQTRKTRYSSAKDWNLKAENLVPHGVNPWYPPLKPGFKFIMEKPGTDEGDFRKEVVVLDLTEEFDIPGFGKFECAVIQEEEFYDGVYAQQALKWFALDKVTNNVYAFGEISWEIDEDGDKVFDEVWRAGAPDGNGLAEPGLLMPGTPFVGARYLFQGDEPQALGGCEILQTGLTMTTPAGTFKDCILIRAYSLTDPSDIADKYWCQNVGLVHDTSEGGVIASAGLPQTKEDLASFGKFHRSPPQRPAVNIVVKEKEASQLALKAVPGDVTAVSLEKYKGKSCWVIEIIAKADGVETDVFVDVTNGAILGTDK